MSNPKGALHILTVHFNTPELTSKLVSEIPRRTPGGRVVYVHILDNCSTPENIRALRESVDRMVSVTLYISDENIGFGEGINALAHREEIDDADVLWLLNPDTRLTENCLEDMEKALDSDSFAIISPLIYSGDAPDFWIWYCGGVIDERGLRVRHELYGSRLEEAPAHPFETEFVTGAAPMMLAATFRSIGGFPRGYFLYWEDTYFSWKARQLAFRLGVVPSARLWHAVGASSGSGLSKTYYYWSAKNRFVFARDIGLSRRQIIRGSVAIQSVRVLTKALLERSGRASKARAVILGSIRGMKSYKP